MKKSIYIVTSLVAIVALANSASAETIEDVCKAAVEAEARNEAALAGCACLQEQVTGNSDLERELISLRDHDGHDARYEAASEAGKAALDACFPPQ